MLPSSLPLHLLDLSTASPFLAAIVCFVLTAAGILCYLLVIEPALTPLNVIPGPKSTHWLFGSLKEILDTKWTKGNYPEPALSWVKRFGGAVHYRATFSHRVMLTDPEALKHVFTTNCENYPRADATRDFLRDLTGGDGLLSTEGMLHTHQRKMLMPHFGFNKIKEFVDVFAAHASQLKSHLVGFVDLNEPVDMHDFFTKLTLDIIGVAAFGYNFGSLVNENDRVIQAYNMMNQPPQLLYLVGAMYIPGFRQWPLPRLMEKRQAKRMLFQTVDNVISAKLQAPRDTSRPIDLVDLMLDVDSHSEHKVSAEEARTHVMTFMLAGHETTSSTLCWIFSMFAKHPEFETMARKESQAVVSASECGVITWKSLGELKYVTACIQEALRLYPTVSALASRVCAKEDMLPMSEGKSFYIPKGTTMLVNTGALHRNPKYWVHPDSYMPDRFLEGSDLFNADKKLRNGQGSTYYYMPFSTGSKNCIGMRFAMAELQVVVANLLLQFSFQLTENADINPKLDGVSIKPVNLEMTIHSIT